ncbi:MAG: ABC transporter ATP-binding protein, partial [Clostridiaceae bacterium]|nr:ABC transporter ATP-binding protein [Clostridiaceae bacterium]
IQMVFQDPYDSLNPIQTIEKQLEEPLIIQNKLNAAQRKIKVSEMLHNIGLSEEYANRYPKQLSGGQLQRVAIGCALIIEPALLLADEPVSSLDVSVQAQILDLFQELRQKIGFACLFISHDLSVVQFLCDRIAVLNQGEIVEIGETEEVFKNPQNDYTKQLIEDTSYLIF